MYMYLRCVHTQYLILLSADDGCVEQKRDIVKDQVWWQGEHFNTVHLPGKYKYTCAIIYKKHDRSTCIF